jgi:hypothetical protein
MRGDAWLVMSLAPRRPAPDRRTCSLDRAKGNSSAQCGWRSAPGALRSESARSLGRCCTTRSWAAVCSVVVRVRFTLTWSEYSSCQRRIQARLGRHWLFIGADLVIAVVGIVIASPPLIFIGLFFAIGYSARIWLFGPWLMWRRTPLMHAEQVVSVSDSGVTTELSNASSTADWTFWSRVRIVGNVYVLQGNQRGYLLIPRRAFGSPVDEQLFRELSTNHTGATFS